MALRISGLLMFCLVLTGTSLVSMAVRAAAPVRCTVIADEKSGNVLYREGTCGAAFYPQSTFKLPLAMIGYDAGILTDAHAPLWAYQPKFARSKREQKDTDPTIWERDSIVWYSQEITRRLGRKRFAGYVARLGYGNHDVTGGQGKTDGLTESWLMSSLKISPDEQVNFLRRFLGGELPISDHARTMTMAIVPHFSSGGWDIQGKTGAGWLRDAAGRQDPDRPLGWFVGWAVKDGRRVVFAKLLVDTRPYPDDPISYVVRDALIAELPKLVGAR